MFLDLQDWNILGYCRPTLNKSTHRYTGYPKKKDEFIRLLFIGGF
jgi:hypothetical protein